MDMLVNNSTFSATTSNLWLKEIEFTPSQNVQVSCNKILKDKYNLLTPAKLQLSTPKQPSTPSPLKPLDNQKRASNGGFNATFPELSSPPNSSHQSNGVNGKKDTSEHNGSGDCKTVSKNSAASSTEIPKPKIRIDNPDEIVLEWPSKLMNRIGPGLVNLGNTCFLNSVIQCLTYCPPLVNLMMKGYHCSKCVNKNICMACTFKDHMTIVFKCGSNVINPKPFAMKLKILSKSFQWGAQEDAHEYLRHVIDNMCRMAVSSAEFERRPGFGATFKFDARSKETTMFNHIFGGYLRSQITCLSCKSTSNTFDHFMDLMLEIKGVDSLERALAKFTIPERLENENSYKCTNCKKKCDATKKFTIHTAPNVLTIQLKRFDHNNKFFGKITKHINFSEELNLKRFMSDESTPALDVSYKLFAVLVHDGNSCRSGHYYCYVRNSVDIWYTMNDSHVQRASLSHVLSQNAYILFYVRKPRSKQIGLSKAIVTTPNRVLVNGNTPLKQVKDTNGFKTTTNGLNGQSNVSASRNIGETSSKFIGPVIPVKKPFLSDPSISPAKKITPFKSNGSSVVIKHGGNRPAVISEKSNIATNGDKTKQFSDTQNSASIATLKSNKVDGSKRLVDYSDESDTDEPTSKRLKQDNISNKDNCGGIRIFSNSSSSNSVSSLSDHSSHSSRDNTPPSNDKAPSQRLSVPVMNGSNTVITKDIIHKPSQFEACNDDGESLNKFGSKVKSWSGASNSVDDKVEKERREEEMSSREDDEWNNEFDAGKTKKVKKNGNLGFGILFRGSEGNGSNPFDSHSNRNKMNGRNHDNYNFSSNKSAPFSTHRNNHNRGPSSFYPRGNHGFKNRNFNNNFRKNAYKR